MKKDIFIFTTLHIINKLYVRGCRKGVFYMSFVIIADSASNLDSSLAKKYGIEMSLLSKIIYRYISHQ